MGARTDCTYFIMAEVYGAPSDNIRAFLVDGTRLAIVFYVARGQPGPRETVSVPGADLFAHIAPDAAELRGAVWALDRTGGPLPVYSSPPQLPHIAMANLTGRQFACDGHVYHDCHDAIASIAASLSGGHVPGDGTLSPSGDYDVDAEPGTAPPGAHTDFERSKWSYPAFMSTTHIEQLPISPSPPGP